MSDTKRFFPRVSPESQGMDSSKIIEWVRRIDEIEHVHSFMLLRHGRVVAEAWRAPYRPDLTHRMYSVSKSFTSVAVGLAEAEGLLSLDDSVASFFPEVSSKELSPGMEKVTIRHLLTMSSGHAACPVGIMRAEKSSPPDWALAFLSSPLEFEPGTRFVYNSGATYMLSVIVGRLTGGTLCDYLEPRLFAPLEIKEHHWETSPRGESIGGWGLNLRTEDMAKFGQLLLQEGKWKEKQIIPSDYLRRATSKQIDNSTNDGPDWKIGYGFQFWRCQHDAFRCDGAFGQYILVMPKQDIVMAVTGGYSNMQRVLATVWDVLLPAVENRALPDDNASREELERLCLSLKISPLSEGAAKREVSRKYVLSPNPFGYRSISVNSNKDSCGLVFDGPRGVETLNAGFGFHIDNRIQWLDFKICGVAASATWKNDNILEIQSIWYETPYVVKFELEFHGDRLVFRETMNVRLFDREIASELTGSAS